MGGKEAKERRRLKRLALQQQADASAGGGGGSDAKNDASTAPSISKSDTSNAKPRPPPSKKMKPNHHGSTTSSSPRQPANSTGKGAFGGKAKFGGKQSNTHAGGKQKASGATGNTPGGKKKFKKPKHLKRKLEALSGEGGADEEKERIRLQQQMIQLEKNKAERAKRFETKMRGLAGDKFDPEVFAELTAKGASKETIRKIIVEGGKMKEPKKTTKGEDSRRPDNKKQKKAREVVDTTEAKKDEDREKADEHIQTPSGSSSSASPSDDDDDDSGSDISLEDIEDISDEECDVYILDPAEVAKKNQQTSLQVQKKSQQQPLKDEAESSDSDSGSSDSEDQHDNGDQDDKIDVEKKPKGTTSNDNEKSGWSDSDEDNKASSSSSDSDEDSSGSSGSSSDDDSDMEEQDAQQKRTRGRGRKGRKGADSKRESVNTEVQETMKKTAEEAEAAAAAGKDKKKRRCIGRKPVTDFIVGQRYDGEVVYVKPFGAFIDIGCHSDAFCHISRASDDYVESMDEVLSPGDKVSPRIVEIDRKQKRLTVSLQSSARIVDERKSIEARKERLKKNTSSAKKVPRVTSGANRGGGRREPPLDEHHTSRENTKERAQAEPETPGQFDNLESIPESEMNPAQLKRARKLARRAERRKQQELTGLSV